MGEVDEDALIATHLRPLALAGDGDEWLLGNDGAKTAAYDAAASDCLVEGTHFAAAADPAFVAEKLLRVNLSDFAAMAAIPRAYLLCLAIPSGRWLAEFARGLATAQRRFAVVLAGGDLAKAARGCFVSLTLLGNHASRPLTRSGAGVGDDVYISGSLGAAAFRKYRLLPRPRLTLGQGLAGLATAAIDISDGLVLDLERLCRQSGVGMRICPARVPMASALLRAKISAAAKREIALSGGEDYELAFTAPAKSKAKLSRLAKRQGIRLSIIGEVAAHSGGERLEFVGGAPPLPQRGYQHF